MTHISTTIAPPYIMLITALLTFLCVIIFIVLLDFYEKYFKKLKICAKHPH